MFIMLILHNEDHVKTRQDGGHEVNVLCTFSVVPATEDTVSCCEDGTARVEGRRNTSLEKKDKKIVGNHFW